MAVIEMNRLLMIGVEQDRKAVLEKLHRIGCVQITNSDPEAFDALIDKFEHDKKTDQLDGFINDINRARNAVLPFDQRKKSIFEPKREISDYDFEEHLNREPEIFSAVRSINELLDQREEHRNEENRIISQRESLAPWLELDVNLDFKGTIKTTALMGVIPASVQPGELMDEVNESFRETVIQVISSDSLQHYIYIIAFSRDLEGVVRILRKHSFNQITFKDMHSSPLSIMEGYDRRLEEIKTKKVHIENELKKLASEIGDIELLYDFMLLEKQKLEQVSLLGRTEKTFVVEGWIPERHKRSLSKTFKTHTDLFIYFRRPEEDEAYPILLENGPLVKPFELITELFSLPNHKEFDVNPFMAPFYFIFFGLMLGDAGYGLILAAVTGVILFRFKITGTAKKLISMVFFGGISSFIWGVLFGSWFGDIAAQVSNGRFSIGPLWFNPLDDPMKLLIWSCIFGVVQLYAGMALSGYKLWLAGKKADAVIDIGLRYIYYTGLILMLASVKGAVYMTIFGAAGLVLTQGRHKRGAGKITGGILSLYDFVGFMSDVLSYSRLLALGLATSVVASVINTMGTLFGMNLLGIVVLVLVFAGGHVFNIAISTLGAYVHSSRLQYVEFFGKFYEGGGKPYKPFRYDTKYMMINNGGTNDDGILD